MTLKFSTRLQTYTDSLSKVELPASTIAEALEQSFARFPDLQSALLVNRRFNPFVKIFLNSSEISPGKLQEISLNQSDEVYLIGAIAGG